MTRLQITHCKALQLDFLLSMNKPLAPVTEKKEKKEEDDGNEDEDTPPKQEIKKVEEDDAFYSIRFVWLFHLSCLHPLSSQLIFVLQV